MTQEEKDLIVKDLSPRIPYGVMVYIEFDDGKIFKIRRFAPKMIHDYLKLSLNKVIFKPYLRPMSSMTKEEEILYRHYQTEPQCFEFYDFCNSRHLDYRSLIPKGLAIEAPKDMYSH